MIRRVQKVALCKSSNRQFIQEILRYDNFRFKVYSILHVHLTFKMNISA